MVRTCARKYLAVVAIGYLAAGAPAQSDNPVYVDDSPQAWELFRHAHDQSRDNPGEAVRLYQELLDEFGLKLIPASEASQDQFRSARQRVLESLASDPVFLERYRLIQTPEAERLLQADELDRLAMTRVLTEPGVEALLRLGQRHLEAARFDTARNWLHQALTHPDLTGRRAAHCHYMIGLVEHYMHEPQALAVALKSLAQLGAEGEAFHAQLQRLAVEGDRPPESTAVSTLDRGYTTDLHDLVAETIWSQPLQDSLLRRRFNDGDDEQPATVDGDRAIDQRLRDAELTTATPTVAGNIVYVNQGHTVLALNRLTGREQWTYSDISPLSLMDHENRSAMDLSVVAVSEGALVTLTGHALANSRSEGGQVLCLDAETGSHRWSVSLQGLIDGNPGEALFPHGAPIIADGMVFVAARKVSLQSLTSTYVVAIDLNTSQVRWWRHITSSGGLQARVRPFCSLLYERGALYLSSAVGAMARIDPVTGEVNWLQRFNVPITPGILDLSRRPWEMGGPVLTSHGLVAIQPDQRRVVLLHPDTGDQLASHSATSTADWNSPRYLLADDQFVYGVGSDVRAFHVDDLEHPAWRLPALPRQNEEHIDNSKPMPPPSMEIRGRVQVVQGALIVPTSDGVLVVDHETGLVQNTLAVAPTGNPLAIDSQLLLACGDRIDAYMSFSKAQAMLRDRIAQSESDPDPALSLLRLGMRVRDLALSLEAARLAMHAINRIGMNDPNDPDSRNVRDELFWLLLDLAATNMASTIQEHESIYATLNAVAVEPAHRVEYHLAYGDWLAQHALDRAIESYQTILSDPVLAGSWRIDRDAMRPASSWAVQKLNGLIEQRGPSAYAAQADFAALRLKQILGAQSSGFSSDAKPDELLALANEFPLAEAAIDATLAAAKLHMGRGDSRSAMAALMGVHQAAPRKQTASRLLGEFAHISQQLGSTSQAVAVLTSIVREYGDLTVSVESGQHRAAEWLASLASSAQQHFRSPRIGTLGVEAQLIEGGLVGAYDQSQIVQPPDRALLRKDNEFVLIESAKMQPLWTSTVEGQIPQVLRFDDRGVLLWFATEPDPKAVMLDAQTGALRWTTPPLADVLHDPVRQLSRSRGIREQMPNGEPFDPRQTLPFVNDRTLFLVQRTGGVVAIDLVNGETVRWSRAQTLEQVHFAVLHDSALVLAGVHPDTDSSSDTPHLAPRILVLDLLTGQNLMDPILPFNHAGEEGVKWMKISTLGLLTYGTADGLEAIDLYTGQKRWSTSTYATLNSQRAWQFDDRLIVEDQRSRLRAVMLRDGSVSDSFETPPRGEWEPLGLRSVLLVMGKLVACYPERVVMYELATGAVAGVDVIGEERDYHWLLPAQNADAQIRMMLINARSSQVAIGPQHGMSSQYFYSLYLLSENCKLLGEPLAAPVLSEKVQQATIIDGWVLLSTQTGTLAIPMPVDKKPPE